MDYALELHNVTKAYPNFKLDNISFSVPKGCIMGFVGENGAGKTTTLKAILDLVHIDSGSIEIFGQKEEKDIKSSITSDIGSLKDLIGVVFDESYFHDNLKLKQISKIMSHIYKNWDHDKFISYSKILNIPDNKSVKEFSRGMKMKLSIAVSLSHGAKLLILDEATSGLDPMVRDEILDIFLEFIQNEEHTILISSHIISDLEKIADYITFIHDGKIVFSESKDELIYNYGILKCKKEDYEKINKTYVIGVRRSTVGVEALVSNKKKVKSLYPDLVVDGCSVEDIILLKSRSEKL